MVNATRPPSGGQESRLTSPDPAGDPPPARVFALRLFALHRDPRAVDLGQLRAVLDFAERILQALRFAAENAVDVEPITLPRELFLEVHANGALLEELLTAARVELDAPALALAARGGVS